MKTDRITWKEAFLNGPGPVDLKQTIFLFLKGLFMGSADIIPGVSGGTIALITGIYKDLINAIKSADALFFKRLMGFDFKSAVTDLHSRFLIVLFSGICLALISLAHLTNHMLAVYPVKTWSLFFGLILASIYVVSKKVDSWSPREIISIISGSGAGFIIVGLIPVTTPENAVFIFFSGMVAICAMILPGISGAFILLVLGKYTYVTGALKNPFSLDNMMIILVFCTGCFIGLVSFSRLLSYLLDRYYNVTIAFLTGLMFGSIRKIWPWKEVVESKIVNGHLKVIRENNIIPDMMNHDFFIACSLIFTGIMLVLIMDRAAHSPSSKGTEGVGKI